MACFKKFLPALLLGFLFFQTAWAARLYGTVKDEAGAGLPFALIFVEGSTIGTTASANGSYDLSLPKGKHKVICQVIGYQNANYEYIADDNSSQQHHFILRNQGLDIKEVVVRSKDEDPAYRIMRKVIKARKTHLKEVQEFQTDIYLKGVLRTVDAPGKIFGYTIDSADLESMGMDSMGRGVLYLLEQQATYYARKDGKTRTIIHSVKKSGDPKSIGLTQIPNVISFYENNVNMLPESNPRGFYSPANDLALNYYNYKLKGTFLDHNTTIYKIEVIPKRDFEPCFRGYIYIVDDAWCYHSLNLTVDKKSNLNLLDTMTIQQQFLPLLAKTWVIKQQLIYPKINFFGFAFVGNLLTVYNNQRVNEPLPDSIFQEKYVTVYDKQALDRDTAYWSEQRVLPLEEDEQVNYKREDSLYQVNHDPVRMDSLRRKGNKFSATPFLTAGYNYKGKKITDFVFVEPLISAVNYNTVEGLNIAPKISWGKAADSNNLLSGKLALRYGFSNQRANAISRVNFIHYNSQQRDKNFSVGLEGGRYVFQFSGFRQVPELFNTYTTLLNGINHLKIYEHSLLRLYSNKGFGSGWRVGGSLEYSYRNPLQNTTTYSWNKNATTTFTPNIPVTLEAYPWLAHHAFQAQLYVSYQPGISYVKLPNSIRRRYSDWPIFQLRYEKGIPGILNSKLNFDKYNFSVDGNQGLRMLGEVSYLLSVGGFLNKQWVSLVDLTHYHGSQFTLTPAGKELFQLMPFYLYSNDAPFYTEAHVEWKLNGFITNKIPLFRKLQWYLVAGTNSMYASPDLYYTEGYIGLDNIGWKLFRFLRVDAVKAWDAQQRRYSGIRLRMQLGAISRITTIDADERW